MFLSYAHEDADKAAALRNHLAPLCLENVLVPWYDGDLVAGQDWNSEVMTRLESSHLIVVLISADFLASEYAYKKELSVALERHDQGKARLIPIIARNCVWKHLPFARLQVLPHGGKPISTWPDQDDAFVSVVEGIELAARDLLASEASLVNEWLTSRLMRRHVIAEVQRRLAALGYYRISVDGVTGPATEQALLKYQRAEGLQPDARIGPEVLRRLLGDPERP